MATRSRAPDAGSSRTSSAAARLWRPRSGPPETDCPGWSVQDNLSHIIGTEAMLLGRDAPAHEPGEKPWIRNPIGASNEIQVDYRRSWPPEKVLDEFREVTAERIAALEKLSDDELAADSWTPIGPGTVRDLLAIRVMDCWVHEQDIRRAVGKPGGLDGPVADHAFGRHRGAIPFVVGKKAGAAGRHDRRRRGRRSGAVRRRCRRQAREPARRRPGGPDVHALDGPRDVQPAVLRTGRQRRGRAGREDRRRRGARAARSSQSMNFMV